MQGKVAIIQKLFSIHIGNKWIIHFNLISEMSYPNVINKGNLP